MITGTVIMADRIRLAVSEALAGSAVSMDTEAGEDRMMATRMRMRFICGLLITIFRADIIVKL